MGCGDGARARAADLPKSLRTFPHQSRSTLPHQSRSTLLHQSRSTLAPHARSTSPGRAFSRGGGAHGFEDNSDNESNDISRKIR